jgi:hypothetical protein
VMRGNHKSWFIQGSLCCSYPLVMTNIAIENGPFIVSLPIKNGDFPTVYQRVSPLMGFHSFTIMPHGVFVFQFSNDGVMGSHGWIAVHRHGFCYSYVF